MVDSGNDPAIATYLIACDHAFQTQIDRIGPLGARLSLPMPQGTAEWEALKRWHAELQRETRTAIVFEFAPAIITP